MKRNLKMFIVLCVLFSMVLNGSVLYANEINGNANVQNQVKIGICGNSAVWEYKEGTLNISGTGTIVSDSEMSKLNVINIIIEKGIEAIDDYALAGFGNLAKVTILGDIKANGNVFSIDTPRELELAGKCTNLGEMISSDMAHFPKITLINNNPHYIVQDGLLLNAKKNTLVMCLEGKEIKLPDTIKKIGNYAFYQYVLESLTLNDNLEEIGKYAFYQSGGFSTLTLGNTVKSIGEKAFLGCNIDVVKIKGKNVSIGKDAFKDNDIKNVTLYGNPKIKVGALDKKVTIKFANTKNNKGVISSAKYIIDNENGPKQMKISINKVKGAKGYLYKITQPNRKKVIKIHSKKTILTRKSNWKIKYEDTTKGPQIKEKYKLYIRVKPYKLKNGRKQYGNWSVKTEVVGYPDF